MMGFQISRLLKAFDAYEEDPNVNLVILKVLLMLRLIISWCHLFKIAVVVCLLLRLHGLGLYHLSIWSLIIAPAHVWMVIWAYFNHGALDYEYGLFSFYINWTWDFVVLVLLQNWHGRLFNQLRQDWNVTAPYVGSYQNLPLERWCLGQSRLLFLTFWFSK